jgi:hypothetical protein
MNTKLVGVYLGRLVLSRFMFCRYFFDGSVVFQGGLITLVDSFCILTFFGLTFGFWVMYLCGTLNLIAMRKELRDIRVGDKCCIIDITRVLLGLPDVKYTVKDVLLEDVPYKVVLEAEEMGEDWQQCFCPPELVF